MRKIMNGGYYPWAPRSGAGYVDIDDVAAAHALAMLTLKASDRCVLHGTAQLYCLCCMSRRSPSRSLHLHTF